MKVKTVEDAWNLAERIFDRCELDKHASDNAGYAIYKTANLDSFARICDLNNRLELNYDDGTTENIWIEDRMMRDTMAVVGIYREKTVFGEVKIKEIEEITYHYAAGMVSKTLDDGRPGIEITLTNGEIASFGNENVAYIRFE